MPVKSACLTVSTREALTVPPKPAMLAPIVLVPTLSVSTQ
jgi:hypothetical protein